MLPEYAGEVGFALLFWDLSLFEIRFKAGWMVQCPLFFFTYLFLYGPQMSVNSCWINLAFPLILFPVQMKTSQHFCSLVFLEISTAEEPNKTENRDHPNGQNSKPRKDTLQNGRPADLPVWDPVKLIFFLFQFRWQILPGQSPIFNTQETPEIKAEK